MELGELDAGLNALDVVRITRESTGTPNALVVDGVPLVIGSGGPAGPQGPIGPQGPQGIQGEQGVPGTSVTFDVWDDLRFPAQGINPAGAAAAPTVDTATRPGTLLFSGTAENIIGGVAQMPHAWLNGDPIHPHVHWAKTTNGAGGVVWQFRYAIASVGGVFGPYSAWEDCTNPVSNNDVADNHALAEFSYIDMTGFTDSCIILWQVRRNPAAVADTYAANARFFEFDIHYRVGKLGSVSEIPGPP